MGAPVRCVQIQLILLCTNGIFSATLIDGMPSCEYDVDKPKEEYEHRQQFANANNL